MKQLEEICTSFPVFPKPGLPAGREIRVLVDPEKMTDNEAVVLSQKIKERIEAEVKDFPVKLKSRSFAIYASAKPLVLSLWPPYEK